MRYFSTNKKTAPVTAAQAVRQGLARDGGLFMPEHIPRFPPEFIGRLSSLSIKEIAYEALLPFFGAEAKEAELRTAVEQAFSFDAPLIQLSDTLSVLELFHGPTLAFKDFGARAMAQLLRLFPGASSRPTTVLVATSGDTGSAVAQGFHRIAGIQVVILYPSGLVSPLQEKQLTTVGDNVHAVEVRGTFDDCQRLAKEAFLDRELAEEFELTSANSINIARLIPQVVYYFYGVGQLLRLCSAASEIYISVPSGNLGNLCSGLFAKAMGLPVQRFIAATNANDTLCRYFESGTFSPRASVSTISNAMDVGNPSNFARLLALYEGHTEKLKSGALKDDVFCCSFSEERTREAMREVYGRYNYVIDPHGAVGYLGYVQHEAGRPDSAGKTILLGTAHPAKFQETVEQELSGRIVIPHALQTVMEKNKQAHLIAPNLKRLTETLQFLSGHDGSPVKEV